MESSAVFMRQVPITPGYSGFVPVLSCEETSSEDGVDQCLMSSQQSTQRYKDQLEELRRAEAVAPRLKPVCSEESVLRALHEYARRCHPLTLELKNMKKLPYEPPIPGWAGFLPRARVTELGCATRYTVMARNCYRDFLDIKEQARNLTRQKSYEELLAGGPTQSSASSSRTLQREGPMSPNADFTVSGPGCSAPGRPLREDHRAPVTCACGLTPNGQSSRKMSLEPLSSAENEERQRPQAPQEG